MTTSYLLANNLLVETALTLDPLSLTALEQAFLLVGQQLSSFASDPEFSQKIATAFGEGTDATSLQQVWQGGGVSGFPPIEIVSGSALNGANGAYALANNRIYLSQEFLTQNQGNLGAIVALLLEEYGHSVDGVLNSTDAPGDDGRIFAALVMGESLSDAELTQLKAENDSGVINLNGQIIQVEQNTAILNTELTEGNANAWNTFASDDANATVSNETNLVKTGSQSLKFVTKSGFDTGIKYQTPGDAHWDLNNATHLEFWAYAVNNNTFQGNQPVIILNSPNGSFRYEPQGSLGEMPVNQWQKYRLPLAGDSEWSLTATGNPTLADITSLEIHQDTWDYGFTIYYDGLQFLNLTPTAIVPEGDLTEGNLDLWTTFASDGANTQVSQDSNYLRVGEKSLKFDTASGFDTGIKYNAPENSYLDISQKNHFLFWAYAINNTPDGFQGNQPIVEIETATGSIRYKPQYNLMANYGWRKFAIPLDGDSQWTKTTTGTPDLSKVTSFEIHQDTWDYGFTVYYDGVEFANLDGNYLPPEGPQPPEGVNPDAINPKVLLYVFDPIMENFGGRRQHEVYRWGDPITLSQQVIQDFQTSSHGLLNYQLVDIKIADLHPYYKDWFQYTDESSDLAWKNRDFSRSSVGFDYVRFINENNLAQRVEKGEIDEVWIYASPLGGMFESVMAGQGAYWINGPTQNVDSDRAFPIMGFNFERGVGEAIHSWGHRAEGIMDHIYGVQSSNLDNNWNKFTFQDRYQTGLGGVGNIHFPVNGTSDYDYDNPNPVLSNADDWYNYPNFTGTTRSFNYQEWSPNGTDPQREYLNWWYDHIPHFSGRGTDYYLNNWWRYLTDIDQFKFTRGNLYLTTGIPTVKIAQVTNDLDNGEVDVVVDASVDGALGRVDLYLDDSYVATDTLAPYTFSLDLATLGGTHTLVAKAYELQNGTESISAPEVITPPIQNAISLEVNPSSVTEDGTAVLLYTFTRTGDLTNSLTVNFSIGGSAIFNTDYTQSGATDFQGTNGNGSIAFTAGENTATLSIDPSSDTNVEPDETVALTIASSPNYIVNTSVAITGTITNDDEQNVEHGTIVVINTNDSGEGSLRWAIEQANNTPDIDRIVFNIGEGGIQTIQPLSALPDVTDSVIIDGTTQPGYTGSPLIELDGSLAGENTNGLVIRAGNSTVKGLVINNFSANGIADDSNATNGVIRNNIIGFNQGSGIFLEGTGHLIESNQIYANHKGIAVGNSGLNNEILGNGIYNNTELGIDLSNDGVTPNDLGDSDTGANNRQNYPLITSITTNSNETTIKGILNSKPNQTYRLEFFANDSADPSGYGEGKTYLDFVEVTTNNSGNANFSLTIATPLGNEQVVTATATDSKGNTSEFSPNTITPLPDLIVSNFSTPVEAIAGQKIQIGWTLKNESGQEISGTWVDKVYLSLNGNKILLGSFPFTGVIAGNESIERLQLVEVPIYFNISGDRSIIVETDADNQLLENQENNNTFEKPIKLNQPPTLAINAGITLDEQGSATISNGQLQVTDPDNSAAEVTYTLLASPANGTILLNGTALAANATFTQADIDSNKLSYQHNGSETTTDSFSFTVSDGKGGNLGNTTFNITVTPVNDTPTLQQAIADQTFNEDTPVSFTISANTFSDVDNPTLTYSATLADDTSLPTWLSFNPTTKEFSGTPPTNFNGNLSIKVTASDGNLSASDTFTLAIAPVNDAPEVKKAIADQSATEGQPFTFTIPANTFSDIDGDNLTYSLAAGTVLPNGITLTGDVFSGTPTAAGTYNLTVVATDAANATASDTFTLQVFHPVAVPSGGGVIPGTSQDDRLDASGKTGTYRLESGGGNDLLIGSNQRDILKGGIGNDRLYGGGDIDRLFGEEGDDLLDGGAGLDFLYGGPGADRFVLAVGNGSERVLDFNAAEGDRFALSGLNFGQLSFNSNQILFGSEVLAQVTDNLGNPVTGFNTRPEWFVTL